MASQLEAPDRGRSLKAALCLLVPIIAVSCAPERPAVVLAPDRDGYAYEGEAHLYRVTVREGDSVSVIAERCDTSVDEIMRLNDLDGSRSVYPGETLRVPEPCRRHEDADVRPVPRPRVETARYDEPHVRPHARPYRDEDDNSYPSDTASTDTSQSWWSSWWSSPSTDDAAAPPTDFMWPVRGRVIAGFGRSVNGERNDGINIAGEPGTPIRAAASGTVTYTGNELKGYGNLVLIRHGDGFVTAYAHAESIRVSRGDHVERGQIIGTIGETGDVDQPQLHFEIRRGVEPVDPRRYLADRTG